MLEKVRFSNWAAPIVPVVKPDGGVRICGDYKVTVNSTLKVDQHPLPNPEELFVALRIIFEARFIARLSANIAGRKLEGVCNNQYPRGTI